MLLNNGEVSVLTENIGGVTLDLQFYSGEDLYSDGVVEDELLKIVSENSADEYEKIITQRLSHFFCNIDVVGSRYIAPRNINRWFNAQVETR